MIPPECLGRAMSCPKCKAVMRTVSGGGAAETFDARLIIQSGPERIGEQFLLGGQGIIKIGKLEGKPIRLEGTLVSRNHCRLVPMPSASWLIEGST